MLISEVMMMAKDKKQLILDNMGNIEKWLREGAWEKDIFPRLPMGKTTWEKYKKEIPELVELLNKGNLIQVDELKVSAYDQALGHTYTETIAMKCKEIYFDRRGNKCTRETLQTVEVQKYRPASPEMTKFLLINKAKKEFALNPQEIERKKAEFKERMQIEQFKNF